MKSRIENPLLIGLMFVITLAAALWIGRDPVVLARSSAQLRPPLVLTPKAQLKTEAGEWSIAPNVPPPIRRNGQRRVVVNWTIKEGRPRSRRA